MSKHEITLSPEVIAALRDSTVAGKHEANLRASPAHANPAAKQPVLVTGGPGEYTGYFKCQREADAWIALSAAAEPGRTPNDADSWLQAWRMRGGHCP